MVRVLRAEATPKLELPGGVIEIGETPGEAVVREVLEETGFEVTSSSLLFSLTTSAGITNEIVHVFRCEGHASRAGDYPISWIGLEETASLLARGQIAAATTAAALLSFAHAP